MDLQAKLENADGATHNLLLTTVEYETVSRGYRVDTPVLHVRARDTDGELHEYNIDGFRPYLRITQTVCIDNIATIGNDRRVLGVEVDCRPELWAAVVGIEDSDIDMYEPADIAHHLSKQTGADVYHEPEPYESIEDEPTARIIARKPGDIGGSNSLREMFESHGHQTFEADIPFERRFLISSEIYNGFEAPVNETELRCENWAGEAAVTGKFKHQSMDVNAERTDARAYEQDIAPADPPDTNAQMVIYDIEVSTAGTGFPDAHKARQPITAITAYSSATDTYAFWGLANDSWERETDTIEDEIREYCNSNDDFPSAGTEPNNIERVELYDDETDMVESFHEWVLGIDPDIITGWNAGGQKGGFDTPYLIQRSYNIQALQIYDYATTGKPGVWVQERSDGETEHSYSLSGRCTLDLLDAYKKTQYRELDSYTLDAVANEELDYGKTGLEHDELDTAWESRPVEFFTYNIRDTQATAEIEQKSELLSLFENLRSVTGAQYETAVSNGPMLDTMFLRKAYEQRLVLPTNTEPAESVYHGAKVFETVPGRHENCVYPDLSSLYPNTIAMLNLGTETIVGDEDDLKVSDYTEEDCYQFPVDEREFAYIPSGEPIDDVDRDKYKGVKDMDGSVREMFEPQYDWFYVLKPEVKESFIGGVVDELIELKNNYTGELYKAVKRVTNSCYGVIGDSETAGLGSRLYDRRVAEGITLAGRRIITHTATEFTDYIQETYDNDAHLIGGDTDSAVSSLPNAPTLLDVWEWSNEAIEYVEASYDEFVQDEFGFGTDDEHRLAVELESVASSLFFLAGDTEHTYHQNEEGMLVSETTQGSVKKRYAQHIVWDDNDGWIDTEIKHAESVTYEAYSNGPLADHEPNDNVTIKGFEYVRSDSAPITREMQLQVLTDILLAQNPREHIEPYIRDVVDAVRSGEREITELARPKGISKHLDDYGWKDGDDLAEDEITDTVRQWGGTWQQTPSPTYRGAKYADDHFAWESLEEGGKPRKIPIDSISCNDYPEVYTYDTYPKKERPPSPEVNDTVDAVAVENPERLPECFNVDYEVIIEKEIQGTLEDITETVGLEWDDMLAPGQQAGLDQFV